MNGKTTILIHGVLVAFAVLAVAILAVSTHLGTGVGGDATTYIYSARDLITGKGLGLIGPRGEFRLLPYFPPFFPLALAGLGLLGFDLTLAAQWLNIALLGGLVWLSGALIYRVTHAGFLSLLLALLLAVSPILIPVYSWAMSEPLCIFLGFLGLMWTLDYLKTVEKRAALVLGGLAAGLSFLTRYSAVAFLAAGLLGILVLSRETWRKRIKDGLLYAVIGALPMLVWLSIDLAQTTTVSSRSIEGAGRMLQQFLGAWGYLRDTILNWLLPNSWLTSPPYPRLLNGIVLIVFVAGMAAWFALATRTAARRLPEKGRADERLLLGWLLVFFIVIYLAVVVVVYAVTFPTIDINSRMLSPVYVAFLWLIADLVCLSGDLWPLRNRLRPALLALLALGAIWFGARSERIVAQNYALGLGYNSLEWRSSATIQAVKALPSGALIVTNEQTAVLYLTGRASYPMMEPFQADTGAPFTTYGNGNLENDPAERAFRQDQAALVLFNSINDQLQPYYGARTAEKVASLTKGLYTSFQGKDGAIYYYAAPGK
jgi:hypothetical protein